MIEVTRLNGISMILNSDLIKTAESSPDTMLTLIHGEKLIVRESCAEVADKIMDYRARLLAAVAAQMAAPTELTHVVAMTSLPSEIVGTGIAGADGEAIRRESLFRVDTAPR